MKTKLKQLSILFALITALGLKATDQAAAQTFTTLHSFNEESADGVEPPAVATVSGNALYGTASSGGTTGSGTIFKLNTDGTLYSTVYNFTATSPFTNSDGASPVGGLVLSGNTLYGTAPNGGVSGHGPCSRSARMARVIRCCIVSLMARIIPKGSTDRGRRAD